MGYYDGRDLPFYWNVAEEYVLFDRFFAASPDGSVANHRLWVERDLRPAASARDLVEVLRPGLRPAAGPGQRCRRCVCRCGTRLSRHVVDLDEYYEDLERGTAPGRRLHSARGRERAPSRTRLRRRDPDEGPADGTGAQQRLGQLGVHVDLRRVGRLVRPRAAAARRRLPGAGAAREPLRAARVRGQHPARHHLHPGLHRTQLAAARRHAVTPLWAGRSTSRARPARRASSPPRNDGRRRAGARASG